MIFISIQISSKKIALMIFIIALLTAGIILFKQPIAVMVSNDNNPSNRGELTEGHIEELFDIRASAYLNEDIDLLESLYYTKNRSGRLAFENEHIKLIYINGWANKQDVDFIEVNSYIATGRIDEIEKGRYDVSLPVSTEYIYKYSHVEGQTSFNIGTYHSMEFTKVGDKWLVSKEWYGDPFGGFLQLDDLDKVKETIRSGSPPDLSDLNERRIGAVEYANKYSGVAMPPDYSFHYNNEYRNYNGHGGDCTNFASQVLYEGGNFPKNTSWNYNSGGSTAAWVGANPFHRYMVYSGRASLIASGSYENILAHSYNLLPGDYIAYERKGKVAHISIVTDFDNKGYALVNSHNTDRYKVPWDIGWSTKDVKIYLVRVHY